MKARLSFARRPSAKPELMSPKASSGLSSLDDDGPPMPEPINPLGELGRSSVLGVLPRDAALPAHSDGPASPMSKSRSKSIMGDVKKKPSSLDGPGAELGHDGASRQIFPSSVREGFLKKKGVVNTAWKKRYIVLLPHQLAYYDEHPTSADAAPKGFIPLGSILKCEHHHHDQSLKDFTFDVTTPTRIFRLQADSLADMDAWVASISGTAANEQQIIASRKRNVSHAALRTFTEEERLRVDEKMVISHELAELRQWPTWNAFEVAAWVQTFGMGRWSSELYNAGITGDKFKSLDDSALTRIGIDDKADRVKILAHVKKLMHGTKRG